MSIVLNGTSGATLPSPLPVSSGGTGLSSPGTAGYILTSNGTGWVSAAAPISLPTQTGNSGKYLTTDGTNASWAAVVALPTQTGNSGKYLTTDGTNASWATLVSGVTATDDTTTNASYYPALFTATSGTQSAAKVSSSKLYFNPSSGAFNATTFNSLSDLNKKNSVTKINNATETIKKINGFEFDWVDTGNHSAGVIAQYLEQILPFLVETNDRGERSVNYSGLIAYLIESNKELSARLDALESK